MPLIPPQSVHAGFCKYLYDMPYEEFKEDWILAARTLDELQVSVESYMQAMNEMYLRSEITPPSLVGAEALAKYREWRECTDEMMIYSHRQAYEHTARLASGSNFADEFEVIFQTHPGSFTHLTASFRIIRAMELGIDRVYEPQWIRRFIKIFGPSALSELLESKVLCEYIDSTSQISSADVIEVLKTLLSEDSP